MIDVIVPESAGFAGGPPAAPVVWRTPSELVELVRERRGGPPFVLVSDGLEAGAAEAVAAALTEGPAGVIEVRYERWDGATTSPVSAACRGVISGFGEAGVKAAVAILEAGE